MAAKTTASFTSWFSFLKEALVLPTRNPKLFTPVFLLFAVVAFLVLAINDLTIQPLAADIARRAIEIKNIDPSSVEYARLLEEIKQETRELVLFTIAFVLVSWVLSFATQIVAFFAASTTYSGDRYSLTELLKVIKGNLKGPFITIAFVGILEFTCGAILAALISMMMRHPRVLFVQGFLFLVAFLAFLCFNTVAMVSIAVSVADRECHGMRTLRQAWRLMTQVRRKESFVLAVVTHLLPTVLAPLYLVALGYTNKNMALGLCLLSVYGLLSGAEQLFSLAAATVYYFEAMETKQVMTYDYAKIPFGEANV